MKLGYKNTALELPYLFIDHYLTGCPPVYPLIYIFSLRRLLDGDDVSMQEISGHFQLTDTDVVNAWRHWERVGLVQIDEKNNDISVTFLPVREPEPVDIIKEPVPQLLEAPLPELPEARPQYTVQELSVYRTQSREIERLFAKAEQALGKLLTYNDMNVIFGFYDWLRLPLEVIEYLLNYCASHNHRSLRYMEKCAIDWAERDIDDLEKAITYVHTFDKNYRSILKRMGKLSNFPTPAQRKQMDKWINEMHMPLDVVLEACDKTSLTAEKPSLSYVDKILAKWHKAGITTLEAIKQADNDFAKQWEKKEPKDTAKPQKSKTNRFINFDQRENDYTQIEQLERQNLLQHLKG